MQLQYIENNLFTVNVSWQLRGTVLWKERDYLEGNKLLAQWWAKNVGTDPLKFYTSHHCYDVKADNGDGDVMLNRSYWKRENLLPIGGGWKKLGKKTPCDVTGEEYQYKDLTRVLVVPKLPTTLKGEKLAHYLKHIGEVEAAIRLYELAPFCKQKEGFLDLLTMNPNLRHVDLKETLKRFSNYGDIPIEVVKAMIKNPVMARVRNDEFLKWSWEETLKTVLADLTEAEKYRIGLI